MDDFTRRCWFLFIGIAIVRIDGTTSYAGCAPAGSYSVDVLQLAQTEIDGTASTAISITDSSVALNLSTATVAFVVGGVTVSIGVNTSTTLNQFSE
ncbi:hypothetical protein [Sulfobacillus thermosulfidooxidans]|uniref:hypothetical protein n=1 Tax=Sulfobacillus thermosulfidooxidans TaxID=28034 RepID=UPI00111247C2|nr:hypothetical protein [Sulfobacillus thermosulfidooxidans]